MKFGEFLSTLGFDLNREVPKDISTVETNTNTGSELNTITGNELNTITGNEVSNDSSAEVEKLKQDLKSAQEQLAEVKSINAAIIARTPVDTAGEEKSVEDLIYNLCSRR